MLKNITGVLAVVGRWVVEGPSGSESSPAAHVASRETWPGSRVPPAPLGPSVPQSSLPAPQHTPLNSVSKENATETFDF